MSLYLRPPARSKREEYQYVCSLHGERQTNLCERCMESLARGIRFSALDGISKFAGDNNVRAFVTWTCKIMLWLFELIAGLFTCLFMMWFFLPEISPDEKRRKDLEWLRRKAADEEWLHRRDAEYQQKLEDEDYWWYHHDPSYRRTASQANSPYSERGIIKGGLSKIGQSGGVDAQLAKDVDRHLGNAQDYHRKSLDTYRRRTTGEE